MPGHTDDNSAHRSETGGLLGKIKFFQDLCLEYNITSGSITSGCDCINVVHSLQQIEDIQPDMNDSAYDLLREIQQLLYRSQIKWKFIHIRGHQDRNRPYAALSLWEKANVDADGKAKAALSAWQLEGRPPILHEPPAWCISIAKETHRTSKVAQQLIHHICGNKLKKFWIHRLKMDTAISTQSIDWAVFMRTMQHATDMTRQFRIKHIAHISGTGVNMLRRRHREDDICPHCALREDNLHLLQCRSTNVTEACTAFTTKLNTYLQTCGCPALSSFLHDLFFWHRTSTPPATTHPRLQFIIRTQIRLGPSAGQWGMYSPELVQFLQSTWTHTRRQRRSASVWFSKLASIQWKFLQDLWGLHNHILHSTKNAVTEAESIRVNQDICNLMEDLVPIPIQLIPPSDRHLFRYAQTPLLSKSLRHRRRWLQQAQITYSSWLSHRNDPLVRPMLDFILDT